MTLLRKLNLTRRNVDFKAIDWFETSAGTKCVVTNAPHDEPENSWLHYVVRIDEKVYKIMGVLRTTVGDSRYKKGDEMTMMLKEWPDVNKK